MGRQVEADLGTCTRRELRAVGGAACVGHGRLQRVLQCLSMNLSLNVALQVTTSASTYGNCMSRERGGGLGTNVQCSAVAQGGGA
jgi:hypothetical protein